jgi:hypothetical protein
MTHGREKWARDASYSPAIRLRKEDANETTIEKTAGLARKTQA